MLDVMTKQLNSGFIMRPYTLFQKKNGRTPSGAETVIEGLIRSFANAKAECKMGYAAMCKRFRLSRSTCYRTVKLLQEEGSIEVQRNGIAGSCYTYTLEADPKAPHVRSEDCFYTDKFDFTYEDKDGNVIKEETRYLTLAEIDILSLIYTHTWHGKKPFEGTYREIGNLLGGYAPETVCRAIKELKAAALITHKERGSNQYKKHKFFVRMGVLRTHGITRSELKKEEKKKKAEERAEVRAARQAERQAEVDALEAKAARDRYYSLRKQKAINDAEKKLKDVKKKEPRFAKIEAELSMLEIEAGKAEVRSPEKLPEILRRKARLQEERRLILDKLGVSDAELKPRWICERCSDTGFLPNGLGCTCYEPKEPL